MTKARDTGEVLNTRGTAATANVQTYPTDTTAGALMAAGAFGLGADTVPVVTNNDCNDITISGDYYGSAGSSANLPESGVSWQITHSATSLTGFATQTAIAYGGSVATNSNKMYIRHKDNDIWENWQPVYTGANYQPETFNGLGVVKKLKNKSGGSIASGATVSGSLLAHYFVDATGALIEAGATGGSGTTWENVSGSNVGNGNGVEFVRIS